MLKVGSLLINNRTTDTHYLHVNIRMCISPPVDRKMHNISKEFHNMFTRRVDPELSSVDPDTALTGSMLQEKGGRCECAHIQSTAIILRDRNVYSWLPRCTMS